MTLTFPNTSRSFDEVRKAVRFVGHDGMFEIRFAVDADALARPDTELRRTGVSEGNCLAAFDAYRPSIEDAARKIYAKARGAKHTLTAADFQ